MTSGRFDELEPPTFKTGLSSGRKTVALSWISCEPLGNIQSCSRMRGPSGPNGPTFSPEPAAEGTLSQANRIADSTRRAAFRETFDTIDPPGTRDLCDSATQIGQCNSSQEENVVVHFVASSSPPLPLSSTGVIRRTHSAHSEQDAPIPRSINKPDCRAGDRRGAEYRNRYR